MIAEKEIDLLFINMPRELEKFFDRLWPLMRSLTGDGARQTHDILGEILPLNRIEVPTGQKVFDWTIPKEWVIREAFVETPNGQRILDIKDNTLHLLNYSTPFRGILSRDQLDKHLYSLPDQPAAIPYRTSYYEPNWGFCISHQDRLKLPEGNYKVIIDTDHIDGSMTLSDCVLPGETEKEIMFSSYTCHPSMANNELSGPLVLAFLYRCLSKLKNRRFTYRFVLAPETIGAIAYLTSMGKRLKQHLHAGYILTCIGDQGAFNYKKSRISDTIADRAAKHVLGQNKGFTETDFFPSVSDERQYCSPGFNLPVGVIMRSMPMKYSEYHTSLDNKEYINFNAMVDSVKACFSICQLLEANITYKSTIIFGEPQLGKRGLYRPVGGINTEEESVETLLSVINLSDGKNSLLNIAERLGIRWDIVSNAINQVKEAGLLKIICEQAEAEERM